MHHRGKAVGDFGAQKAENQSVIGKDGKVDVQPRGEVVGDFGVQKAEQLSVISKGGKDWEGDVWERVLAAVRDMSAEVQKAERLSNTRKSGKVEVQPRNEVIRNVLQVFFGVQTGDKIVRDVRDVILEALASQLDVILGAWHREEVIRVVLDVTFGALWTWGH